MPRASKPTPPRERRAKVASGGQMRERRRSASTPVENAGEPAGGDNSEQSPQAHGQTTGHKGRSSTPVPRRQLSLVTFLLKRRNGASLIDISRIEGYDDIEYVQATDISAMERKANATFMRRFLRDRQDLERIGIRIEERDPLNGHPAFRITPGSMLAAGIDLEPQEMVLLDSVQRAYTDVRGMVTGDLLMSAIIKLKAGTDGAAFAEQAPTPSLRRALAAVETDAPRLDTCLVAHAHRKPLRFRYKNQNETTARVRVVEPWGVVRRGRHCYVTARDRESGELRVFRLSRMQGTLTVLEDEPAFEIPADFALEDHFGATPLSATGGGMRKAVLRFDADTGFIIANEFKGLYPMSENRDGSVTMTIPAVYAGELFRYLAEFAGHVEVLSPRELVSDLRARLEETLAVYGDEAEEQRPALRRVK